MARKPLDQTDKRAIRHSLECSIPTLKRAALDHVKAVVRGLDTVAAITERLGISRSTWWEWVQASPELRKLADAQRDESTTGPVPDRLK